MSFNIEKIERILVKVRSSGGKVDYRLLSVWLVESWAFLDVVEIHGEQIRGLNKEADCVRFRLSFKIENLEVSKSVDGIYSEEITCASDFKIDIKLGIMEYKFFFSEIFISQISIETWNDLVDRNFSHSPPLVS